MKKVLLDIGSTLLTASFGDHESTSPVDIILKRLGLDPACRSEIAVLLFKTNTGVPEQLCEVLLQKIPKKKEQDPTQSESVQRYVQTLCNDLWQKQIMDSVSIEGASELLDTLKRNNIEYAFASNIWAPFFIGFITKFPAEAGVPAFLSYKEGLAKPYSAFYEKALARLGWNASDVLMIGDSYDNDIEPALRVGMSTLWVLNRPQKEMKNITRVINALSDKVDPDYVVGSTKDITEDVLLSLLRDSISK